MATELKSDVIKDSNPSYNNTELSTLNRNLHKYQHDDITHEQCSFQDNDTQGSVRMDRNPSYGRIQGCNNGVAHDTNTAIKYPNLSRNSNLKSTTRAYENEYYEYHSYDDTRGMGYLRIMASASNTVADNIKTS